MVTQNNPTNCHYKQLVIPSMQGMNDHFRGNNGGVRVALGGLDRPLVREMAVRTFIWQIHLHAFLRCRAMLGFIARQLPDTTAYDISINA